MRLGVFLVHFFGVVTFFSCHSPWKNNKWWAAKKKQPTKAVVSALLKDGRVRVTGLYSEKTGKTYDAAVVLEDDGQYANFKLEFDQRKGGSR